MQNGINEFFGKGVNQADFENISSNGIIPFESLEDLLLAISYFRAKRNIVLAERIERIWLKIVIAESSDELDNPQFIRSKSLILIWTSEEQTKLVGQPVEGRPILGHVPAACLVDNGIQAFDSLDRVKRASFELSRQSGTTDIKIATFQMKKG